MVINQLGHTAEAVAAHFRFAAVCVEHAHPGVGPLRLGDSTGRANQNQSISANSKMTVTYRNRQSRGICRKRVTEAIDIHIVVAQTVHFYERNHHKILLLCGAQKSREADHSHSMVAGGLLEMS